MSALKTRYRIEGMDCASCASKIDTAVRRVAGVEQVSVSVTAGTMTVEHEGADLALLEKRVTGLGYKILMLQGTTKPAPAPAAANDHDHASCSGHDHDHGHKHGDHAGHDHAKHDHKTHDDCAGHDHGKHDHGHDHKHAGDACCSGHDHAGHDHAGHDHAGHDHAGHDHAAHDHAGHDHAPKKAAAASAGAASVAVASHGHDHGHDHGAPLVRGQSWWQSRKGKMIIICGLALVAAYGAGLLWPALDQWLFTAAMLVGLVPIARRAFMAALSGTPFSIEMLMTIAAIGAVFIGASEEASAVVFLFLVGELLEGVAAGRARESIRSLADLVPKTARVLENGVTREVPASSIDVGAIILVRPGERIPADGDVLEGIGSVNEAPVTGESVPVGKEIGDSVFAGTVNGESALTIRASTAASDNTIARVVRLVEEAQESKAPTERFIDSFSRWYTPFIVVLGALVAVVPPLFFGGAWDAWIYKGLAILLIGCPCALVISTPAAIAAALASGARRGLLIKGGAVLEVMRTINVVAFDKTGTLTEGKPKVTDVVAIGRAENDVIRLAAALEDGSTHPLASAILADAAARSLSYAAAQNSNAIGGEGITGTAEGHQLFLGSPVAAAKRVAIDPAQLAAIDVLNNDGKTVSVLLVDGAVAGFIAMRDEPRADAAASLKALADAGIRTIMLTGDNVRTGEAVGRDLGIEVRAGLMPADKQRIVGELQAQGLNVAKVGDGINDAPALAAANVGIAMGGGTDVALETADAAVLHGRVGDVGAMIDLSKRAMSNIHQNITIALGLKAVFLVTTIIGVTGLWPAILADTGATVLVTANALRLLGGKK